MANFGFGALAPARAVGKGGAKDGAVVVGGSMRGLLAGHLLLRGGWDVDVYERVGGELSGRGAGIVAQPELIARLRAIDIDPEDLGVQVPGRKLLDATGKLVGTLDRPQIMTSWERVYRALRDVFPAERYHRGKGAERFEQDVDGVVVHFGDGEMLGAELLVSADGIRSTIRQQCAPELVPLYAGYIAWRALLAESAFPEAIHRELFGCMTFCLPP